MGVTKNDQWDDQLGPLRDALVVFFSANMPGSSDADDLASDVLLVLLKRRARGDVIDELRLFAFGVAKKLLQAHFRLGKRDRMFEDINLDEIESDFAPPSSAVDDSPDERFSALRLCLAELGTKERSFVEEYYGDGKNAENRAHLAMRLGIGDGALFLRASRVRKKLRGCILRRLAAA
jgi:DNA-directed RNA polymerase specialized sigma24 family protein